MVFKTNLLREVIRAEIEVLLLRSNAANLIKHGPTIGEYREELIQQFLRKIFPHYCEITTGIIYDVKGRNSVQVDGIVYDNRSLPRFTLSSGKSLVPIESVLIACEVKSTLEKKNFEQVRDMTKSISSLEVQKPEDSVFIVPNILFAYDSKVSEKTTVQEMEKNSNLILTVVLNGYSYLRMSDNITVLKPDDNSKDTDPTFPILSALGKLYEVFNQITNLRKDMTPGIERYLQGFDDKESSNQISAVDFSAKT